MLRTAAHAIAEILRAAWRLTVAGLRFAGRLVVRAAVALKPVGRLTGRVMARLVDRTIVLGSLLVLAVRVALWATARALAAAGRATRTALRAMWRAAVVVGAPVRAAIRWAASAIAAAIRWAASMLVAAARGAGRLIAAAWRDLLQPALRKAAFALKVAFAVVVVLPAITARRAIAHAIAVLRRPMPAAIRSLVQAVRASVRTIRRSLSEARTSITSAIRGARDGVRRALHDAREGIANLFGNRPAHRGGPRHP